MTHGPTDWVIGRGLLGSSVVDELAPAPVFASSIAWADPRRALQDLSDATADFLGASSGRVRIYWCAGKGVGSATAQQIQSEVETFRGFLNNLGQVGHGREIDLFLASSVGGAYSGRNDPPYTESTPPLASSPYGEGKLAAERLASEWATATGNRVFIARITNLYGPGQDLSKGQGLISTILLSYITHTPASIYVSLDTLRDYIFARDCARIVIAGVRRLPATPSGTAVLKIVGAGVAVSIGAILSEIKRLRRSLAPIVIGPGPATAHARDLRVRSEQWTDLDGFADTTLPAGISETYSSLVQQWAASK